MLRTYLIGLALLAFLASMVTVPANAPDGQAVKADRQPELIVHAPVQALQNHASDIVLPRQSDGHFYVDADVNGAKVRMLVDTGASGIALSRADARRVGIGISIGMPNVVGKGASGDVRGEYIVIDRISLGEKSATAVPAVVLDGGSVSLLGQSFLKQFASVEIRGDRMVLR